MARNTDKIYECLEKETEIGSQIANNYVSGDICKYSEKFNKVYQERGIEKKFFKLLDDYTSNLKRIILTGWAGSGKTSLLKYALSRNDKNLNTCKNSGIAKIYFNFEENHIDYTFIRKDKKKDRGMIAVVTRDASVEEITKKLLKDIIHIIIENEVFDDYDYLSYLILSKNFLIRHMFGGLIPREIFNNKTANKQIILSKYLSECEDKKFEKINTKITSSIRNDNLISKQYIHTISYLISQGHKILLIFDNIDIFGIKEQSKLYTVIHENLASLHNLTICSDNIKVVSAMRTENLHKIQAETNLANHAAIREYSISGSDNKKIDTLQIDNTLIYRIYKIKLGLLNKDEYPIVSLLNDSIDWFCEELPRDNHLSVNLFRLSNHSIRISLKVLNNFLFWMIRKQVSIKKVEDKYHKSYIHSLFYAWMSSNNILNGNTFLDVYSLINKFEQRDLDAKGCSLQYQILTSLSNTRLNYITVKEFIDDFTRFVKCDKTLLKDMLFNMYINTRRDSDNTKYGHLIFMYNSVGKPLQEVLENISDSTRIRIMPRGKELLNSSVKFTFLNYQYLNESSDKYFSNYPRKFIVYYMESQIELLARLMTVNMIELTKIYINLAPRNQNINWIDRYKEQFGKYKNGNPREYSLHLENIISDNIGFLNTLYYDKSAPFTIFEKEIILNNIYRLEALSSMFTIGYSSIHRKINTKDYCIDNYLHEVYSDLIWKLIEARQFNKIRKLFEKVERNMGNDFYIVKKEELKLCLNALVLNESQGHQNDANIKQLRFLLNLNKTISIEDYISNIDGLI